MHANMRLSRVHFPYDASGANPHGLRRCRAQRKKKLILEVGVPNPFCWEELSLLPSTAVWDQSFHGPAVMGLQMPCPDPPVSELGLAAAKNPIEMPLSGLGPSVDGAGEGGSVIWGSFCPDLQPCSAKPRLGSAAA